MPTPNYNFPVPSGTDSFKAHRDFKALGEAVDEALKQESDQKNKSLADQRYYSSIQEFGAKGDGVTDDTAAFLDLLSNRNGKVLYLKNGASYNLASWQTLDVTEKLTIVGLPGDEKPILNGNIARHLFNCSAPVTFVNVHFKDWNIVADYTNLRTEINQVRFEACTYENVRSAGYCMFDTKDAAKIRMLIIKECDVRVSRSAAFGFTCRLDRVIIENNTFDDVIFRAISIGNNAPGPGDVTLYQDYWRNVTIKDNTIKNVHRSDVGELQAVIVYGWRVNITGNFIENVYNGDPNAKDCEGIYTKARYANISENTLINASGEQGGINVKGQKRGLFTDPTFSPESFGITVKHNKISSRRANSSGIHFQTQDILLEGNYIEGVTYRGIWSSPSESGNVSIMNNQIVAMEGRQAIYLRCVGENIQIKNNIIDQIKGVSGTLRSVGIHVDMPSGYDAARFRNYQITGNTIRGLLSKGTDDWAIRVTSSGGTMRTVFINGNIMDDAYNGVYIATAVADVAIKDNHFDNITATKVSYDKAFTVGTLLNNRGFVTKRRGTATITNNQSSVTVAHGLNVTPEIFAVQATPRASLGNLSYYVTNVNATTFDIFLSAVTPNSIPFSWVADAEIV